MNASLNPNPLPMSVYEVTLILIILPPQHGNPDNLLEQWAMNNNSNDSSAWTSRSVTARHPDITFPFGLIAKRSQPFFILPSSVKLTVIWRKGNIGRIAIRSAGRRTG
jgi:hypothetical protein